jgi:beta-glucosidase
MKVDPMKPARVLPVVFAGIVLSVLSASSAERHPGWLRANDARVEALLSRMTLEEKVGQMTQAEQDKLADVRDIETYFLGSLLSGGSSDPKTNSFEVWRDMYDRYQSHALKTRLAIPILYGVDAVHGHNNVLGAVIFPHNIGLGATRDATLVEEVARATAREVRATGIQWAFAPCVTVPRDERWGRTYEGYAEDPQVVAELGAAAVRGLQGDDPAAPTSVLACVKHFAGDGGTIFGTGRVDAKSGQRNPLDRGDVRLSEAELKRIHMPGYRTAIDAGAMTIMPSYNSWNGEKASGSRRLLTDILKGELGFDGFLISDYDAIEELPGTYREQVKASVLAGMDMFMVSARYREFYTTLKGLVEDRSVPAARIDDAVRRILRVKVALGLLDERRSPLADRSLASSFGSTEHRALGRRAVRESLVLLKNDKHTLPLSKTLARIHVAGERADDLGSQCGGWTIGWQGTTGASTTGTTILGALRKAAAPATKVTYSADGRDANGADVVVVVVGETPYAEFEGDRDDLSLSAADRSALARAREAGVPVVTLVISGRPLILGDALAASDALVAAWLPGTEGEGVTDVLFGDTKPTGKLPMTWPRTMAQIPINVGDAGYDPLFPYGHGLTYDGRAEASEKRTTVVTP